MLNETDQRIVGDDGDSLDFKEISRDRHVDVPGTEKGMGASIVILFLDSSTPRIRLTVKNENVSTSGYYPEVRVCEDKPRRVLFSSVFYHDVQSFLGERHH